MNILKTLGEKFRLARKEPKEFTLGYDLYAEMLDHMMKNPPSRCDWFEESIYAVPVLLNRDTNSSKMYELSSKKS